MKIKFLIAVSLGLLFFTSCSSQTNKDLSDNKPHHSWRVKAEYTEQLSQNESVLPVSDGLYVSNLGGAYILHMNNNGEIDGTIENSQLTMPTGMALKDRFLYVGNGSQVLIFDLENIEADPLSITFPDELINDIAINEEYLYASGTYTDTVYRVAVGRIQTVTDADVEAWAEVPGPNGLTVQDGIMYIASSPADFTTVTKDNLIYQITDLEHAQPQVFYNVSGLYDGIAVSKDGRTVYVSERLSAQIIAIDAENGKTEIIYKEEGSGPADIALSGDILYIPDMVNNRILLLER